MVNFAAESHVDRSIENPEIFLKTNILGTQVLMDACRNVTFPITNSIPSSNGIAVLMTVFLRNYKGELQCTESMY